MKYILIALVIYMLVNIAVYAYVYHKTKNIIEEKINWDGWFNKFANILIVSVLATPAMFHYFLQIRKEMTNECQGHE